MLYLCQIFILLLGHLHFFVHFFFSFMENLFMEHPIPLLKSMYQSNVLWTTTGGNSLYGCWLLIPHNVNMWPWRKTNLSIYHSISISNISIVLKNWACKPWDGKALKPNRIWRSSWILQSFSWPYLFHCPRQQCKKIRSSTKTPMSKATKGTSPESKGN